MGPVEVRLIAERGKLATVELHATLGDLPVVVAELLIQGATAIRLELVGPTRAARDVTRQ